MTEVQEKTSMPITSILSSEVPADSVYDASYHPALLNLPGVQEPRLAVPFALYGLLQGDTSAAKAIANGSAYEVVSVDGESFLWLTHVTTPIWQKLPLATHEVVGSGDGRLERLIDALEHLARIHPEGYELLGRFVRVLTWVRLAEPTSADDVQITSSSFPSVPMWIFFSDKASVHIPPSTVAATPSPRFFAENLLHEAMHQVVNYNLLTRNLFVPTYDTRSSPKVRIAWRQTSIARNQFWELDRVFHAAIVYESVLDFRRRVFEDPKLADGERNALQAAIADAIAAARYLATSLSEHSNWLTGEGKDAVSSLRDQIEQTIAGL